MKVRVVNPVSLRFAPNILVRLVFGLYETKSAFARRLGDLR